MGLCGRFLLLRGAVLLEQQMQAAMRMARSAAAPAAAKTISTKAAPPRCTGGAGGELRPSLPDPLEGGCSGGEWVLAGETGAPWDLAAGGGGGESPDSDGAGEDEALGGGGVGGNEESGDGGGAAEGLEGLLFGGDGAGSGLVEELDDMARHETVNLHKMPRRLRRWMRTEEEEAATATASRLRPSCSRARTGTAPRSGSGQARRARSPGTCASGHFTPAAISRGAKNSRGQEEDPHGFPCLLLCFCFGGVLLCC
ncbi:unnamed protein product [Urochloa humidicola]